MKVRVTIGACLLSMLAALAAWGWWQTTHGNVVPNALNLPESCQMCKSPPPVDLMTPDSVPLPQKDKVPNDFFPMGAQRHSFNTQPY